MTNSTPPGTEDRLRRALEARADQVTTHSLRRPVMPARAARRHRWAAPVALLSAAAVTVVAAGALVVRSGSDDQDAPPVGARPDRVETSGTCRREASLVTDALAGAVRTAEGTTYSAAFDASALPAGPFTPQVMGFPDFGDPGAEIVVNTAARADGALAQLFTLTDTGLVRVATPGSQDGNFLVEGGGVTYPEGAGCTQDRALVLSTASAVNQGRDYEVTRRTYEVTGDDLEFTGPEITSRTAPAVRLAREFPEFGNPHFDPCPPR